MADASSRFPIAFSGFNVAITGIRKAAVFPDLGIALAVCRRRRLSGLPHWAIIKESRHCNSRLEGPLNKLLSKTDIEQQSYVRPSTVVGSGLFSAVSTKQLG